MTSLIKPIFSLVVPTLNPGRAWHDWVQALEGQSIMPTRLVVIDSESADQIDLSGLSAPTHLEQIPQKSFGHGRTRNHALRHLAPGTEIVVFLTQDALLAHPSTLANLVDCFSDPSIACAFGRQLPHTNATPIAAHARLFNYKASSHTIDLRDKARMGLKACFLSNSFSAYRIADLHAVGGFPDDVILGEDTCVAAKLLLAGRRIRYQADACVYHSHNYAPIDEFRRYFDTGVFHSRARWLLNEFGSASDEGKRFVISELRYLWKAAPQLIPAALLRTAFKLAGYRLGRLERWLPLPLKRRCSMFRNYWPQAPCASSLTHRS